MRILAIDPGPTTGFALFNRGAWDVWEEEVGNYADFANAIEAMLTAETLIICERFQFLHENRDRMKIDFTPAELVGVIKFVAGNTDNAGLVMQNPSVAVGRTAFWGDGPGGNAKLKKLKLWFEGKKHGRDAVRHILWYITFTRKDDYYLTLLK
jgi:hypothetical protein